MLFSHFLLYRSVHCDETTTSCSLYSCHACELWWKTAKTAFFIFRLDLWCITVRLLCISYILYTFKPSITSEPSPVYFDMYIKDSSDVNDRSQPRLKIFVFFFLQLTLKTCIILIRNRKQKCWIILQQQFTVKLGEDNDTSGNPSCQFMKRKRCNSSFWCIVNMSQKH